MDVLRPESLAMAPLDIDWKQVLRGWLSLSDDFEFQRTRPTTVTGRPLRLPRNRQRHFNLIGLPSLGQLGKKQIAQLARASKDDKISVKPVAAIQKNGLAAGRHFSAESCKIHQV